VKDVTSVPPLIGMRWAWGGLNILASLVYGQGFRHCLRRALKLSCKQTITIVVNFVWIGLRLLHACMQ